MKHLLSVNDIEVVYERTALVLRGVSLQVSEASSVAVLGANGAGKSTMLKAISGLLGPELGEITAGNIQFDGQRIDGSAPQHIVRIGIVQVMEGRRVLEHLSVDENLRVAAYHGRSSNIKRDLARVFELFPRLKDVQHTTSGYLSGGEQQMLVLGRALVAKPKLILLDEPSLGLSPLIVREIFSAIRRINEEDKASVLLVEQNASIALDACGYGYVLENGRVVLDGPANKLRDNEDVREFYLGLSELGERKTYREVKHYRRRKRWLS